MNQRILINVAVAGALLFSSYGHAESEALKKSSSSTEQLPQKQISNKTLQAISFKGVPLGKAGVKDALKKMCKEKKFNTLNDRCSFADERSTVLLDYETLMDSVALITLSSDKALVKVVIDGSTQEMLTLAKALEKKYGKPAKQNAKLKKEIGIQEQGTFVVKETEGAQLEKDTFVWEDDRGSRITIESIYTDYNQGGVTIQSPPVSVQDTANKREKESGK